MTSRFSLLDEYRITYNKFKYIKIEYDKFVTDDWNDIKDKADSAIKLLVKITNKSDAQNQNILRQFHSIACQTMIMEDAIEEVRRLESWEEERTERMLRRELDDDNDEGE